MHNDHFDRMSQEGFAGRDAWLDFVESLRVTYVHEIARSVSSADVPDVLQDFYVRTLRYWPRSSDAATQRCFANRLVRSAIVDHLRRAQSQVRAVTAIKASPSCDRSRCEDPLEKMSFDTLRDTIEHLPSQYATLIVRIDIDEEARDAVARSLGITTNNLGVRLLRAHAMARSRLKAIGASRYEERIG